jgi:hypothetical protein
MSTLGFTARGRGNRTTMKQGAIGVVTKATIDRVLGERPSSMRALLAAAVTGAATAALTYRALRSDALLDSDAN